VIPHPEDTTDEYHQHCGAKETEAESVAYVVAGSLGLDTTPTSIHNIRSWTHGDADTPVLRTVWVHPYDLVPFLQEFVSVPISDVSVSVPLRL
jgi:hypothetical protein